MDVRVGLERKLSAEGLMLWTVVLEKTLESPLDCKEIQPVHHKGDQSWALEGLMLKLKLQYFGHLMWIADSSEKTLMLGKIEGRRRRGDRGWDGWMASPTQWTWVWVDSGSWWWTGRPGVLQSMGSQRVRYDWATELNWTTGKEMTLTSSRNIHVGRHVELKLIQSPYFICEKFWAKERGISCPVTPSYQLWDIIID